MSNDIHNYVERKIFEINKEYRKHSITGVTEALRISAGVTIFIFAVAIARSTYIPAAIMFPINGIFTVIKLGIKHYNAMKRCESEKQNLLKVRDRKETLNKDERNKKIQKCDVLEVTSRHERRKEEKAKLFSDLSLPLTFMSVAMAIINPGMLWLPIAVSLAHIISGSIEVYHNAKYEKAIRKTNNIGHEIQIDNELCEQKEMSENEENKALAAAVVAEIVSPKVEKIVEDLANQKEETGEKAKEYKKTK